MTPDADSPAPPILDPVTSPDTPQGRRRTPMPAVLAAVLLGAVVAASSALAAIQRAPPPPDVPTRFGPGTRGRVLAVATRATEGLLALRTKDGDFTTRGGGGVDPAERREATALAVFALSAAKRMGVVHPELDRAIAGAKQKLFTVPKRGVPTNPSRSLKVSSVAAAVLALSVSGDPADAQKLPAAVQALLLLTEPGPPVGGWAQGIAARAYGELLSTGRSELLVSTPGGDPTVVVPTWDNLGNARDAGDPRVSEALALAIKGQGAAPPVSVEIFQQVVADPIEWVGAQTDLARWALRAWLARRIPDGERWFASALGELEKAVEPDGRIEGEIYGYPVARSSQVLIILWEGWTP